MSTIDKVSPDNINEYELKLIMIKEEDTRTVDQNPQWYMHNYRQSIVTELKNNSTVHSPYNTPNSSGYCLCQLTTYIPWGDKTGGYPIQMLFDTNSNNICKRIGISDTEWGEWDEIYTEFNKPSVSDVGANKKASYKNNTLIM